MASTPKWNTRFFFAFSKRIQLHMSTLGLKEMGKFLWEGIEKDLPYGPVGFLSLAKLN